MGCKFAIVSLKAPFTATCATVLCPNAWVVPYSNQRVAEVVIPEALPFKVAAFNVMPLAANVIAVGQETVVPGVVKFNVAPTTGVVFGA